MRILCGTDFSAAADVAALVAAKVAGEMRGRLHVVSVIPGAVDAEPLMRTLAADADDLTSAAPKLADLETAVVRADDAAAALVLRAAELRAELIVVAARGASMTADRVGRVAERVAADSNVAVLVVQDGEALLRWLDRKESLRVLLSASLKPSQDGVTELVGRLRALSPCDVTALHVASPPSAPSHGAASTHAVTMASHKVEERRAAKETLLAELQRRVGDLTGAGEASFTVDDSFARIEDRILAAADERRASLIALGSHRRAGAARFFHASVAGSVLRHARTNVLIVPDTIARDAVPHIGRVLVPVDRVEGAAHSVAVACSLLGASGGEVQLLHVADADDAPHAPVVHAPDAQHGKNAGHGKNGADAKNVASAKSATSAKNVTSANRDARDALVTAMKNLAPKNAAAAGIRVTASTVDGPDVAQVISAVALANGADVICMRSRTRRRGAALLGSVLDDVMRTSSRPVVVVGDEI